MVQRIQLTRGQATLLDDVDYWLLRLWHWHTLMGRLGHFYAVRQEGGEKHGRTTILMHREIMNPPDGYVVDHIDGDGLNNQRANLRICTQRENIHNARRVSKSGYKGVVWRERDQRFHAYVKSGGKQKWLGAFRTAPEAALAYDAAARQYFGVFAGCNFPEAIQ